MKYASLLFAATGVIRKRIALLRCGCHLTSLAYTIPACLLLCMITSCTVDILPRWRPDDAFVAMKEADKRLLKAYDKSHSSGSFVEVGPGDVHELVNLHHGLTWLVILSSWCPHALKDQQRLLDARTKMQRMNVQLLCLYTDFHPAYLEKKFSVQESGSSLYIMMHRPDVNQEDKIRQFIRSIGYDLPEQRGVPQHFLLDPKGQLIYAQSGEVYDPMVLLNELVSDGDLRMPGK